MEQRLNKCGIGETIATSVKSIGNEKTATSVLLGIIDTHWQRYILDWFLSYVQQSQWSIQQYGPSESIEIDRWPSIQVRGSRLDTRTSISMSVWSISFNEILKARLGFDIYEMNSLRNDLDLVRLIYQTIRVCSLSSPWTWNVDPLLCLSSFVTIRSVCLNYGNGYAITIWVNLECYICANTSICYWTALEKGIVQILHQRKYD